MGRGYASSSSDSSSESMPANTRTLLSACDAPGVHRTSTRSIGIVCVRTYGRVGPRSHIEG